MYEPKAKRIFEVQRGILEGCNNRAWPSRPCLKNCQNCTFLSMHGIWKFFGPNDFIWGAIKVPFFDFIQKCLRLRPALCKCLSEMINWIVSTISHRISKTIFVYGFYEFLAMLQGKIREAPFFKDQSGKTTVCWVNSNICSMTFFEASIKIGHWKNQTFCKSPWEFLVKMLHCTLC